MRFATNRENGHDPRSVEKLCSYGNELTSMFYKPPDINFSILLDSSLTGLLAA